MDVLTLSRLQFAVATLFHFLFVPVSMGLPVLIAIFETRYARSGNPDFFKHARFWGRLLMLNFVVGVVTGLTLEFQFGTNWSRYSKYVGDVFGPLLAAEVVTAFFLESTFISIWFFGWNKLSPKVHAVSIWLVALAANLSAFWILLANGWMQAPQGYAIRNGRAELTSFWSLVSNPFSLHQVAHTILAGFTIAGFFVVGISAYQILRRHQVALFSQSFRLGALLAFLAAVLVVVQGHLNGEVVADHQPAKLASMEPTWETGAWAPVYLFLIPDQANERNLCEFGKIPGMLSVLAYRNPNAVVKGLKDFPREDRPPILWTFASFRVMVTLGFLLLLLGFLAWWIRNKPEAHPWILKALVAAIPLPYLASEAGWTMTEMGRQPWIVYGILRTKDAASDLACVQVATSLFAFLAVYSILGLIALALMIREIRKGIV